MRTSILCAAFLGLFAAGCAGDLSGTGGDDQQIPENCGNGTVDSGEACDDSNNNNGDGCSAACQMESSSTPRVMAGVDKTMLTGKLGTNSVLTLTLSASGGFAGDVAVAMSAVDAGGAVVPGVTVEGPATVNVALDGTATAMYTVKVASNASGTNFMSTVKLDVTPATLALQSIATPLSVDAIFEVHYADLTGTASPKHPLESGQVTIKRGTKIQFYNDDSTLINGAPIQHITHGGPKYPHQTISATTGLPGSMYEVATLGLAPGPGGKLGCHNHQGDATYIEFILE